MTRQVLVPAAAAPLFPELAPGRFTPLSYAFRAPTRRDLWLRRLGRAVPDRLVAPSPPDALASVDALWLGGEVELPAADTERLLARLPGLAWVYSQRTGIDHLPLDCYRRRGIVVSNSGTLTARWVAEMGVACLVGEVKQLQAHRRLQDRHRFQALISREFIGLHVLVIGTGAIGGVTARLCRGLGMRVTGASRNPGRLAGAPHDYDAVVDLGDALTTTVREADAVMLALPQAPETIGLVSDVVLARMPPGAILINLARPRLVDERALLRGLHRGRPGAAYVSRTETLGWRERLAADRLPNFHLTHVSEAHVPDKLRLAFAQFVELSDRQRAGDVGNRVC